MEQATSRKYKTEDFTKFTIFKTPHRTLFWAWGGNGKSYLRALRLDTPYRKSMLGIGNTLEKGRWWKGKETGGVPKFMWVTKEPGEIHLFVGRLAILIEWKKALNPPYMEFR